MKTAKTMQMLDTVNNNISPATGIESLYYEGVKEVNNNKTYYRYPLYNKLPVLTVYDNKINKEDYFAWYKKTYEQDLSGINWVLDISVYDNSFGSDVSVKDLEIRRINLGSDKLALNSELISDASWIDVSARTHDISSNFYGKTYLIKTDGQPSTINEDTKIYLTPSPSISGVAPKFLTLYEVSLKDIKNIVGSSFDPSTYFLSASTGYPEIYDGTSNTKTIKDCINASIGNISNVKNYIDGSIYNINASIGGITYNESIQTVKAYIDANDNTKLNYEAIRIKGTEKLDDNVCFYIFKSTPTMDPSCVSIGYLKSNNLLGGTNSVCFDANSTTATGFRSDGKYYIVSSSTNENGIDTSLFKNANIYMTTAGIYHASDIAFKENIKDISDEFVDKLFDTSDGLIRDFTWKEGKTKGCGFIAQEILDYIPEAVSKTETYSVNYDTALSKVVGALFKKIKQQDIEIQKLKKLINQ